MMGTYYKLNNMNYNESVTTYLNNSTETFFFSCYAYGRYITFQNSNRSNIADLKIGITEVRFLDFGY